MGIGQDKPVTASRSQGRFARGHVFLIEKLSPSGGGVTDDAGPGPEILQNRESLGFSTPVGRVVTDLENIKDFFFSQFGEKRSVMPGNADKPTKPLGFHF